MAATTGRAPSRPAERIAFFAAVITTGLAAVKIAVGLASSSLAVLSQAIDTAVDVVAIGLVFFAVRLAGKPADESHHYGHGKAENLVAFTQTLLLGAIIVGLGVEALGRLSTGDSLDEIPSYAVVVLAASAVIDTARAVWLHRAAQRYGSEALRAGALNFATDVGTGLVALVSVVLARSGNRQADAAGALIVCVAVGFAAYRLGRRAVDVLMDRAPRSKLAEIEAAAAGAPGVAETRRVRVRGSGPSLFADVTVATGRTVSLERAHDIAEGVEREIAAVAPGTDVVVHVEPASATSSLVERVHAAASRAEGVTEVHNVLVHAFDDRGQHKLHVTLHAKAEPGLSLEEAHDLADRVEAQVIEELGDRVRVDSHIEPMEQTVFGKDVTTEREDIARSVATLATEEPDILDCHEVVVTQTGGELSVVAHVRGRGTLSLSRLHDASQRIENAIHAKHPEIGAVLIHFEPGA